MLKIITSVHTETSGALELILIVFSCFCSCLTIQEAGDGARHDEELSDNIGGPGLGQPHPGQ